MTPPWRVPSCSFLCFATLVLSFDWPNFWLYAHVSDHTEARGTSGATVTLYRYQFHVVVVLCCKLTLFGSYVADRLRREQKQHSGGPDMRRERQQRWGERSMENDASRPRESIDYKAPDLRQGRGRLKAVYFGLSLTLSHYIGSTIAKCFC